MFNLLAARIVQGQPPYDGSMIASGFEQFRVGPTAVNYFRFTRACEQKILLHTVSINYARNVGHIQIYKMSVALRMKA